MIDIQYTDGDNILIEMMRLDTLSMNKQFRSLTVTGKQVLTTRTDYVNKYKSVLQTILLLQKGLARCVPAL